MSMTSPATHPLAPPTLAEIEDAAATLDGGSTRLRSRADSAGAGPSGVSIATS